MPLFGAALAAPNKGTDFYQQCQFLQKMEFKDFSRPLHDFPVLFKAYLIFMSQDEQILKQVAHSENLVFYTKLTSKKDRTNSKTYDKYFS